MFCSIFFTKWEGKRVYVCAGKYLNQTPFFTLFSAVKIISDGNIKMFFICVSFHNGCCCPHSSLNRCVKVMRDGLLSGENTVAATQWNEEQEIASQLDNSFAPLDISSGDNANSSLLFCPNRFWTRKPSWVMRGGTHVNKILNARSNGLASVIDRPRSKAADWKHRL